MYRSRKENLLFKYFLNRNLYHNRKRLKDENNREKRQKKDGIREHSHNAQCDSQSHTAGVPHKEPGGINIEPEEREQRSHHRSAHHRQLIPSQGKSHSSQGAESEKRDTTQESVQTVCFVSRKSAGDDNE